MSIEDLKQQLPDFAKDVRLNLSGIVNDETLAPEAKYGLLLACAITSRNRQVIEAVEAEAAPHLSPKARDAARAAASIMAMNNVYYRFVHLASNKEYGQLPAKLRMNVIGSPGIDKADFELFSLAVSAQNGCGMCIDAHEKVLKQHNLPAETIQAAARFGAVMTAAATVHATRV